ncbi:MAG TPA: fumarylacetoacetate hydrolase family protein [Gemmatimonadaceae bacterium]|jgi:2-keto-4-pentenoate hydratase/2-oxohepta-3-ene-1,7-dioic acid hydratase in catechol pathway|nr:fumarylacetoacetate hydrolase family protein [Gemmatimonadaceae bacterium]
MPTLAPTKIVCVGRNYAAHAKELGNAVPKEPLLFLKPPSSLIRSGESIRLPTVSNRVEYEGEIGVVIGRRLRKATPAEALGAIANLCAANDVTARDLQKSDVQFTRAKGFDTFCAVGELGEVPTDLAQLRIRTLVNGQVRQDGSASDMVFDIPTLVSYISNVMTLESGDLVLTGTPEGVGTLASGDVVEVEIAGVSRVSNPVTSDL